MAAATVRAKAEGVGDSACRARIAQAATKRFTSCRPGDYAERRRSIFSGEAGSRVISQSVAASSTG